MHNIESLMHAESVSSVTFQQGSISSVKLHTFLKIQIEGNLLAIIRLHKELLTLEFIPHNLR